MSSVSLADSNSCPLNHQYHYIQYPGYYEHITQQQQQQQQQHLHHNLQHHHQHHQLQQQHTSQAYAYCNCLCSCGNAAGNGCGAGAGGGGGVGRTATESNGCHHAPQSSVDSQMAVAVIVHRGGGSGGGDSGGIIGDGGGVGGISNKQSQSQQSLLNHSYQALQQLTPSASSTTALPGGGVNGGTGGIGDGDEHKPLNVLGNSKLNISCDCDLECTCSAATNANANAKAAAAAASKAAAIAAAVAQKRGALHDAMLAADEITVSESDNNSTMKKRSRGRGGGGSNTRSSKKFNSWCVHNDSTHGTPLPEKRCDAHYHHHHQHHHHHHNHRLHHASSGSHLDIYCDGDEADALDVYLKGNGATVAGGGGGDEGDGAAIVAATDSGDHRPPLPPRPPPRPRAQTANSNGHRHGGHGGSSASNVGLKKYVIWCLICGGFSCLLGVLFLGVYFLLHSYTITVGNFETVPTFVPATLLILTGLCIMSLARRRNRYSYLIKLSGACGLISALTCALVTVTTTVLHMSRLQALRECEYAQKTRTCTCYSNMIDSQVDHVDKEGVRLVFDSLSDCGVVHGSLYSCLRAIFGLSVAGVLIAVFSCMLVYQLLSHERKKMYWEQLELRCRSLYTSQQGPPPSIAAVTAAGGRGVCRCCEQCHAHRQSGVVYPAWDDGAGEPPRFWTGQPPGNFYSPNPCAADELHMGGVVGGNGVGGVNGSGCRGSHRGMPATSGRARTSSGWSWPRSWPWQRNSPGGSGTGGNGGTGGGGGNGSRYRQTPSSPDSQYGFSNSLSMDGVHNVATAEEAVAHTMQQPFSVMPPSALPYGVWGPPPPYSDPNSPARRGYYQYVQPPTSGCAVSNNLNAPPGERSLMVGVEQHHHHHHHQGTASAQQQSQVPQQQLQEQLQQQQQQTQPTPHHMPCLNHRAAFLDQQNNSSTCCGAQPPANARGTCSTIKLLSGDIDNVNGKKDAGGGGVGGGGGEYENTHSDSDGYGGGDDAGDNGDGVVGGGGMRDRFSNTLPSRKIKKRVEAGVKSIGPNSHGVERVNVQHVFGNGNGGGNFYNNNNNTNSSDLDMNESSSEQLVSKQSMRHKRSNNNSSGTNNNKYNNCVGSNVVVESTGNGAQSTKDVSAADPAESEVYFADVSSCCNISVKNDNYYDDPNPSSAHHQHQMHHCHSGHNHGHGHGHGHTQHSNQPAMRSTGAHHQHQSSNCSSHNSIGSSSTKYNGSNSNNNNNSSGGGGNEDYLAQRFGQRENSIRSRLPFPQPRSDEDDYERGGSGGGGMKSANDGNGAGGGMPKDNSRQSMCSSVESEPQTEYTDLSPATPCGQKFAQLHFAVTGAANNGGVSATQAPINNCNKSPMHHHGTSPTNFVPSFPPYSSEQQSLEAHRRSTKNIHELLIPTDTPHYEVINDQFPIAPTNSGNGATAATAITPSRQHHLKSTSTSMTQRHGKQQRANEVLASTPHKIKTKPSRDHLTTTTSASAAADIDNAVWSTEQLSGVGNGGGGGGGDRMRL